jgi:hypothetical protein
LIDEQSDAGVVHVTRGGGDDDHDDDDDDDDGDDDEDDEDDGASGEAAGRNLRIYRGEEDGKQSTEQAARVQQRLDGNSNGGEMIPVLV